MALWEKIAVTFLLVLIIPLMGGFYFVYSHINTTEKQFTASVNTAAAKIETAPEKVEVPPEKLANPPAVINAIYVTGWSAGTKSYINYLTDLFKTTEINAVVIDIKDYSGLISYYSEAPEVQKYKLYNNAIPNINALVKFLHDQNIYVIGRIAVFEDPAYSKARPDLAVYDKSKTTDATKPVLWLDNHKLSWLDPSSKDVWDYNISLAKDAFSHGFDEINFDYIRFPSDGKTENMGFSNWDQTTLKSIVISNFFQYLRASLPNEKLSVDLFGQTTVNTDDMGIGQKMEDAFLYVDYVSPMVYPSHYINGFIGFQNPADHPYEVIKYCMDSAVKRQAAVASQSKFRPWIQDFNMGAIYNAGMVEQEIQALKDSLGTDYNGFMLWNPSNIYTKNAILKLNPTQ